MESKLNKIELIIYQRLGVKKFRQLVLYLEKRKHRKDQGKNSNYHIYRMTPAGIQRHFAFLSYNSLIHIISILILLLQFLLKILFKTHFTFVDVILLLFIAANIYCIMLQRFNALRMRRFLQICRKRQKQRMDNNIRLLQDGISPAYGILEMKKDLMWLEGLRRSVGGYEDVFINDSDIPAMDRLAAWIDNSGVRWGRRNEDTSGDPGQKRKTALYSKADQRVRSLQKLFGKTESPILLPCALITESRACENSFCRLFPGRSRDSILEEADTLLYFMGDF